MWWKAGAFTVVNGEVSCLCFMGVGVRMSANFLHRFGCLNRQNSAKSLVYFSPIMSLVADPRRSVY